MIKLLLLVPYLVVLGGHALVAFAMPEELKARNMPASQVIGPLVCYAIGSLGAIPAVVGAVLQQTWAPWLAVVAAVAVIAGPLWWGQTIGEFHLSHHLVRFTLVAIGLVLYFFYVRSYW